MLFLSHGIHRASIFHLQSSQLNNGKRRLGRAASFPVLADQFSQFVTAKIYRFTAFCYTAGLTAEFVFSLFFSEKGN